MLYSVAASDDLLRTIDPTDGSTLSSVTMTLSGATLNGATGLAFNQLTSELFGILKVSGQSGRELVTINPSTGVAMGIGNTGDAFAGLAFGASGTLYGVTGDGASTAESLFTLNTSNATPTFVRALGNGDDGEAIGFNPDDGLIYHASGFGEKIFETIDPGNGFMIVNVPLSGDPYNEGSALTYAGAGEFFLSSGGVLLADRDLLTITTGGVVLFIGDLDHVAKGLAFVDEAVIPLPAALPLFLVGLGLFGVMLRRRA